MAASLGPWTVLLAGLLLDPGLRRRLGWRRAWPVIPPVACGCLQLALSESGSTFALMAALLVICAGEVWRMVHAPRPSQLVMVALILLSVASVLNYAISRFGSDHLESRIDYSWGPRGLDPHGPHTQPFRSAQRRRRGWPRPVSPIVIATGRAHQSPNRAKMAIWSVAVRYYAETGLLGAGRCWPC